MEALLLGLIGFAVLGGVGYWIAGAKGRSGAEGCALGCLLGPIGWIIEAVLPTPGPVGYTSGAVGGPDPRWAAPPPDARWGTSPRPVTPPPPPAALPPALPADTVTRTPAPATLPPPAPRATRRCPDCAEDVLAEARICRHCRHVFADVPGRSLADAAPEPVGMATETASEPGAAPAADGNTDAVPAGPVARLAWPEGAWSPAYGVTGRYAVVAQSRAAPVALFAGAGSTVELAVSGGASVIHAAHASRALAGSGWRTWSRPDGPAEIVITGGDGDPLVLLRSTDSAGGTDGGNGDAGASTGTTALPTPPPPAVTPAAPSPVPSIPGSAISAPPPPPSPRASQAQRAPDPWAVPRGASVAARAVPVAEPGALGPALVLIGGIGGLAGTFLPWLVAAYGWGGDRTASGLEAGPDGLVALALSGAIAFVGLLLLAARGSTGLRVLALLGGVALIVFAWLEISNLRRAIDLARDPSVALGSGLYVIGIAGVVAIVGGLLAGRRSSRS